MLANKLSQQVSRQRRTRSCVARCQPRRGLAVASWSRFDPSTANASNPAQLYNLVEGRWHTTKKNSEILDPMNGEKFIHMPDTQEDEVQPFVDSLWKCPKTGLHNPLKNVERYVMYGDISAKAAALLSQPEIEDHFTRCIQRVCPKSYAQAQGEVRITRTFLQNFSGDQVRFLARGFSVSGDRQGQESQGYRWPFGPVAIVSPFNFPLEIPILQLMGALYMGNKPVIKSAETTSMVLEEFLRMLHHCGMPTTDVDLLHGGGRAMNKLIMEAPIRLTQFTGSSQVAELLAAQTHGKVRLEDAGFDWKIIGPDVGDVKYVAWQCDQDTYSATGQKCSAQSIAFIHSNWRESGLYEEMQRLAERRNLADLTVGPVLTHTTDNMLNHAAELSKLEGARVMWGGMPLQNHSIPDCYGAIHPTAVFVPLSSMLSSPEAFRLCTTEIFGPFQVITEYDDDSLVDVLKACEAMSHHLTAAVVSNDPHFTNFVMANTVNGTSYKGRLARTTAAPQNHWFGPAGDPRGAGIGTPEAIKLVWSCHREIITDIGPVPEGWTTPEAS